MQRARLTIPHGSIALITAGSVPLEVFDSSDSIDDLLLKSTLAAGRLKEALRSGKQGKQKQKNKLIVVYMFTVLESHTPHHTSNARTK